jgi:dihydroxyacetone kinase
VGVALNTVTIPGSEVVNDRLAGVSDNGEPMMEIGLGIHGEAGMKQCTLMSCDDIAKHMLEAIQSYGREVNDKIFPLYNSGDQLVVLVNNLGGTSNFEMSLLARSLVTQLENDAGCKATRVLVGSFMTSFDMQGASVSLLPLNGDMSDEILNLIDADTDAPAWGKVDIWKKGGASPRPSDLEIAEITMADATKDTAAALPPVLIDNFGTLAASAISKSCTALIEAEPELTKFDTIVGDGDCGITMARGAKEILQRLESQQLRVDHPFKLFMDLADAVSASMGGTSGILLELMFRKASTTCASGDGVTSKQLAEAFEAGIGAVSLYGGAREGSRTMLDALFPGSSAMFDGSDVNVAAAAKAARQGADNTAKMKHADAGRSNYVSDLKGTPDPGAVAVAVVLEAVASVVDGV